jgi:hypothetical protein
MGCDILPPSPGSKNKVWNKSVRSKQLLFSRIIVSLWAPLLGHIWTKLSTCVSFCLLGLLLDPEERVITFFWYLGELQSDLMASHPGQLSCFDPRKKIVNVINNTPGAHLTVLENLCNFGGPVLKESSTVSAYVGRNKLLVLFCISLAPESWNNQIKPWNWPLALKQVHKLWVTENRATGKVIPCHN